MKKINVSFVLIALMIAAFLIGYSSMSKGGSSEVAQKAVDYINQYFLGDGSAVLISTVEESGVYKFKMDIEGQEYESYLTKDGKILFPDGINLAPEEATVTTEAEKMTCEDLKKTKEPVLEAFVVSQCPFGLQMHRIVNEIVKNMPELNSYIEIKYIGAIENGKITAMHGDEEAQENLRQICVREEQKENYWAYIDCYIKEGQTEQCLTAAMVNASMLDDCIQDQSRGLKYAQEDFNSQDEYGVTGSPTLILNKEEVSEFDFGGRTAEAVKTVICCGFEKLPDFCSQKLAEDSAAAGFSPVYSSGSANSNNASCN